MDDSEKIKQSDSTEAASATRAVRFPTDDEHHKECIKLLKQIRNWDIEVFIGEGGKFAIPRRFRKKIAALLTEKKI